MKWQHKLARYVLVFNLKARERWGLLRGRLRERGQSLLETALFLPILLVLVVGMVEVAVYALSYMTILDASREAARFGSNLDPALTSQYPFDMHGDPFPDVRAMEPEELRRICNSGESTNFYYEVACLAFQNVPPGMLDIGNGDDIVITVVGVQSGDITYRWPVTPTQANSQDQSYHFRTCNLTETQAIGTSECGSWSLYGNHSSGVDYGDLETKLVSTAPNTGFVIVEIFHAHAHFTGLFNIAGFMPESVVIRPYSIFPVPAAEPR